jgi:hypothetical protein
MSLEMAHKVIVPQKKNYVPQFLKQRDINSYNGSRSETSVVGPDSDTTVPSFQVFRIRSSDWIKMDSLQENIIQLQRDFSTQVCGHGSALALEAGSGSALEKKIWIWIRIADLYRATFAT